MNAGQTLDHIAKHIMAQRGRWCCNAILIIVITITAIVKIGTTRLIKKSGGS